MINDNEEVQKKVKLLMDDLRRAHPDLFSFKMDDDLTFQYLILHSVLITSNADQAVIDCAFEMMQQEMRKHPEKYHTLDELLLGEEEAEEDEAEAEESDPEEDPAVAEKDEVEEEE